MKLPFGKKPPISKLHRERVAAVAKRNEAIAAQRQELAWENDRKLQALEAGPVKELADFEAAIRDFEIEHGATIATETLSALRKAASTFGNEQRTAALAIRDVWRAYVRRIEDELGATEPNYLLLAAMFVDEGNDGGLGSPVVLEHGMRPFVGNIVAVLAAMVENSVPRLANALQHLEIGVDDATRYAEAVGEGDIAKTREILACATFAEVQRRAKLGDRFVGTIGDYLYRMREVAELLEAGTKKREAAAADARAAETAVRAEIAASAKAAEALAPRDDIFVEPTPDEVEAAMLAGN